MALQRRFSLKRNKEFRHVYRAGKSVVCRDLVLVYRRSGDECVKVGFSVSKKLGGSVMRNRIKRRMREAFSQTVTNKAVGVKLIFIARAPILGDEYADIMSSMKYLLKKAELSSLYR